MANNNKLGLEDLPVKLLYDVQLDALSDTLPHASQHLYHVFKSAPPSFHASYILRRVLPQTRSTGDIVPRALEYPLCTMEVFDALCHCTDSAPLRDRVLELPRRLFRDLPSRGSGTEDDHPLPFLKHLSKHFTIRVYPNSHRLMEAGQACFLPLISFLLDHCIEKQTPLFWAATYAPHLKALMKHLLAQGDIHVNARDLQGRTPLWRASALGHDGVVKLLLAHDGVDVNSKDDRHVTPLLCAVNHGREGAVALLLARGDIEVESKDGNGMTALYWAACAGHDAVVKLLLARDDVDVNSKDFDDWTPLYGSASRGHEGVARLLLERDDIDVNVKDADGWTPLLTAASLGYDGVVKLLLARNDIDVDSRDVKGRTPLSVAVCYGHEGVVALLLAQAVKK